MHAVFIHFDTERRQLKSAIVLAVEPCLLDGLRHQLTALAAITIRGIIANLQGRFGTPSATQLNASLRLIAGAFPAAARLQNILGTHRRVHQLHASAGNAISIFQRTQHLKDAVVNIPHLRTAVGLYVHNNPRVDNQDFDGLAAALETADNNAEFAHFAASAMETPEPTVPLTALAADNPQRPKGPQRYCWTHGPCGHTSADCFTKKPGHRPEATMTNQLGGRVEPLYAARAKTVRANANS